MAQDEGDFAKTNRRSTIVNAKFNDHGMAKGWFYGVPEVFKPALDIFITDRVKTDKKDKNKKIVTQHITQGITSNYCFNEGDVFYAPHGVRSLQWEDAQKIMTHMLQIKSASPRDSANEVHFIEWEYLDGKQTSETFISTSQEEFVGYLKNRKLEAYDHDFANFIRIEYRKKDGEISRHIISKNITIDENGDIKTYSYSAPGIRTFNAKNILSYYDMETGEVFEPKTETTCIE